MREDAWDAIVALDREHGQKLFGYALRLGVDACRSADRVQEAPLRLWHELGRGTVSRPRRRGRTERSPTSPWASTGSPGASQASSPAWVTGPHPG